MEEFQPEHAGKMNFYLAAVDDLLRHQDDAPSIGLLLCKSKNRVIVEYALRDARKPIGVAEWQLTRALPLELTPDLPAVEALEEELVIKQEPIGRTDAAITTAIDEEEG
jgi:hypothetical protein